MENINNIKYVESQEIDDTSSGWLKAIITLDTMIQLVNGEIDLISLDWK
jgi:hypothetical protein